MLAHSVSDDASSLADWLATPTPGIALLSFRSQLTLQEVITQVREMLPQRPPHIVIYDPARPDAEGGNAAAVAGKCRELVTPDFPSIFLRPVSSPPGGEGNENTATFWKNLNFQRETLGALPAQIVLCLDEAQLPYAYAYAKDLISWCAPQFLFPALSQSSGREEVASSTKTSDSNDFAASHFTWRALHPAWSSLIEGGKPITHQQVRQLLLPLMEAALDMGLVTQAEKLLSEAGAIEQMLEDERLRSQWLDLAGNLAMMKGDLPAARASYTAGLKIRETLAARDPENTQWQRDLSISHEKLGNIATAQGDLPAARASYTAQLKIAETLAARDPENTEWQRDVALSFSKLATIAEIEGDEGEARKQWLGCIAVFEKLIAAGKHVTPQDKQTLASLKQKLDLK